MKIKKIPIYILCSINIACVVGMLLTGFADRLDPRVFGWLSLMGYAFPAMLLLTIGFMILWVFIKLRYIAISFIGLLMAYAPVSLYCPINQKEEVPEDAFEVISYNTEFWGKGYNYNPSSDDATGFDEDGNNIVMKYLADSGADILCLQESADNINMKEQIDTWLIANYEYRDSVMGKGGSQQWIYSKHPIVRKELIPIKTKGNIAAAFWVRIKDKEVILVNCHLQTTGLSIAERESFSDMMHGKQETDTMRTTSKAVFRKLLDSAKMRASQAESIASFLRMHCDKSLIVCGDFNDIPQSFVRYTIANALDSDSKLQDCYQQTGRGPGYTFSHYGMRVRIDNMLCTSDLTPYNCRIDSEIDVSDHYPIRCSFVFK